MLELICITFIAGILFGLSLFSAQKVLFLTKNPILLSLISTVRLIAAGSFFYIMLKSTSIHPIILVSSFLVAYWLIILKLKELFHGRQ